LAALFNKTVLTLLLIYCFDIIIYWHCLWRTQEVGYLYSYYYLNYCFIINLLLWFLWALL